MKIKLLAILVLCAGFSLIPITAKAAIIQTDNALGCQSFIKYDAILEAQNDPSTFQYLVESAIQQQQCKFFNKGEEMILLPANDNIPFYRVRPVGGGPSYYILKPHLK